MNEGTKISQMPGIGLNGDPHDTKLIGLFVKRFMFSRFPVILFLFSPILSFSQIGLNVKYLFGKSDTLEAVNLSQDGIQASIEYAFRLKEKRLEFHPGLGYRTTWNNNTYDGYFNSIDLDFNTSIYPFDFGGDCDCPTFSKEGNLVKKGFFFEVSPGVAYQVLTRLRSDPDDPSKLPIRSKNVVWKIGGAAGLDIGLSEEFTLTPIFSATLLSSSKWDGLHADGSSGTLNDFVYFGTGLRLNYKSDPKHRRRY